MTTLILSILGSLALIGTHWAAWFFGAQRQAEVSAARRKADMRCLADALARGDVDTVRRLLGD